MGWSILSATGALWLLTATPGEPARAAFDRGEKALAAGQLDDAANSYQEALKTAPRYADALNGLGSVYFKQGKREQAIAQFRAAIDADAGFKLAYFNLGYACRKTGDYASAAKAYEKYAQLDPNDPDAAFGLGESYRSLGQSNNAITAYQRYVNMEKRPTEQQWVDKARGYIAELQRNNAGAPMLQAQPAQAAVNAGAQASAGGKSVPERVADGDRLIASGQADQAVLVYDSVLRDEPGNVEALFKAGNALARQRKYSQAIDRWTEVTQKSGDPTVKASAQQNIDRARAKLAGNAPPPAVAAPAAAPAHTASRSAYEQGVRQISARDYAGAYASLSQAIQAEPTLGVAYVARGSAQVGLRHYNEAALDYQRALSLEPQKASALYGLAEALRAQGKNPDAKMYYQRYAESTAADARPDLQNLARQKASAL